VAVNSDAVKNSGSAVPCFASVALCCDIHGNAMCLLVKLIQICYHYVLSYKCDIAKWAECSR